ncbi:MAG: hypothetical protein IJW25_03065, partial [Clostridia bacterium]|nr:hypothetical protein [Clostridia bacterium]
EGKRMEIDRAIKNNYKRVVRALFRKLHRNTMFTLYMLLMFAISVAIYCPLVIFEVHFVLQLLVEIVAWVFLWEAVDQWFLHRRNIKHEMLKNYRFVRADIVVLEYKPKKKKNKDKFGKNAKSLNNILKRVDKNNKKLEDKIQELTNEEIN